MNNLNGRLIVTLVLVVVLGIGVVIALSTLGIFNPSAQLTPTALPVSDAPVMSLISPEEYQADLSNVAHQLIDVRTPEEFATGHIAGAVNVPLQELETRLNEISPAQPIVVYCRSGNRSAEAAELLNAAGYSPVYDLGGVIQWTEAGFSLE
jgi:rhodanese-related sulfurtransferase